ncbi:MAG: response regulator [Treponema sp.]|nr:response regulator [Candidatus Treponema merdequi]
MYNILLTDDEQIVIDTLSLILNRNFNEEVNIFTALSGTNALEIVRKEKIDIIFMDIHMPGINGLETISLIKQINPNIVICILSAYDQFQYAQEAINLGAYKYLTKPVNRNLIVQTVRNCMGLVDTKRGVLSNNIELHEKLSLVSSIVESDFIYSCIFSNSSTDFSSYLDYFEIKNIKFFMCCIELSVVEQSKRYDMYMKLRDVLTSKSRAIIGSFMTNRVGAFFPIKDDIIEDENPAAEKIDEDTKMRDLMQNLYSLLSLNVSSKIRIGVSQVESDIQHSSQVYNNALTALNSTSTSGGLAFYSDTLIQNHENAQIKKITDLSTRIINRIKVADAGSVSQLISEYCLLVFEVYESQPALLKNHLIEFIFNVRACAASIIENYHNEAFDSAFSTLASTDDKSIIEQYINDRCLECVTAIASVSLNKSNPLISKACSYIEENISKEISLDQLADYLGVSNFYLSKLFKEETGDNYISYVTELRLAKAKKLLQDDSLIIKEVTSLVGYNDQNYFSKLFKNKYGLSPTEYRETLKK